MAEQRIVITIDENGKINASTEGLKGETCLEELQKLMGDLADLNTISKTDEFYQKNTLKTKHTIKNKKK